MIDIAALAAQVKRNCHISDAKFWGCYSLCGILLKLREMYRIENGIRPYEALPKEDIGIWITERERLWKQLEDKEYEHIVLGGKVFDPFSVDPINELLDAERLLYGAGYGLYMKPFFFLADLRKASAIDGLRVYVAGREYARDLSDHPAMTRNREIVVRTDVIRSLLWQRLEEMRCNKTKEALVFAFSRYGISPDEKPSGDLYERLEKVSFSEAETYIYHEVGEAYESERIGDAWKQLLVELSDGRAGLFARSVKDVLADTTAGGMLSHISEYRKEGSLGFYIVFLGGMRKAIFPEIVSAFHAFMKTGDWHEIDHVRQEGYAKAKAYADRLLQIFDEKRGTPDLVQSVESELLSRVIA